MQNKEKVEIEILDCKGELNILRMNVNDSLTVGRGSWCDRVVAGDEHLSRYHFLIEVNHSNVLLKDLGSTNGTYVNGERLINSSGEEGIESDYIFLNDGDKVEAGQTVFKINIKLDQRCAECGMKIPEDKADKNLVNKDGQIICNDCFELIEIRKKAQSLDNNSSSNQSLDSQNTDIEERISGKNNIKPEPFKDRYVNPNDKSPAEIISKIIKDLFGESVPKEKEIPRIGGYENLTMIGEGGYGSVYKAIRGSDGREVALKVMLQTERSEKSSEGLFKREQEILLQLKHPNITNAYKCSHWNELHFIEMEYLDGGNLFGFMKQHNDGKVPFSKGTEIMIDVAKALSYAHQAELTVTTRRGERKTTGVIHRDMKPPNILIQKQGSKIVSKVSDFGLAKAFKLSGLTLGDLTKEGMWRGTHFYMAPEHIINYQYVEPVTDVFETMATFFHMLTGEGVWPCKNRKSPTHKDILYSSPKRLKEYLPSLPKSVHELFDNSLTTRPDDRIKNGVELLKEFERVL